MTFLNAGLFVAGALCVSIPILVHLLLRQRRKPIRWGAMRFLLEAYRKQRRKLKLQQLILLATRCLVILLLALAIGRPLLEQAGILGGTTGRTLYLLIDNSLASSARDIESAGAAATALDRHKEEAKALLQQLGSADQAGLVALGAPAQPIIVPSSSDISAVLREIDKLTPTDGPADVRGAIEALAAQLESDDAAESGRRVVIALLSEFLLGTADVSRPLPAAFESIPNLRFVAPRPVSAAPSNVQIVGIEPLRPIVLTHGVASGRAGRESVRILLRRSGPIVEEDAVTSVRLRVSAAGPEGRELPGVAGVVRWRKGEDKATANLQIDPTVAGADLDLDSIVLIAEIDRDSIAGDNIHRRPITLREALRVGIIGRRSFSSISDSLDQMGPADWIRLALNPSPAAPIDLVNIDPSSIDAPTLASLDVAFATAPDLISDDDWARLRVFVDGGGLLIVNPAHDASVHLWSDALDRVFELGWRIAREPKLTEGDARSLDDRPGESPILEILRDEIGDLVLGVSVKQVLPIDEVPSSTDVLLRLRDGTPWLVASSPGVAGAALAPDQDDDIRERLGIVVYIASAPSREWTNLQWSPLMVPLMHELSIQGYGQSVGDWSSLAGRRAAAPARAVTLVSIDAREGPRELDLGDGRLTTSAVRAAGLWEARDEGGRRRGFVAVNADPDAGRTTTQDAQSVRRWLLGAAAASGDGSMSEDAFVYLDEDDPGAVFASQNDNSPLSFPLLLGALALALAELGMARWFSHAQVERPSRAGTHAGLGAAA